MCGVQVLASFCLNIMAPPLLTPQKEPPDIKWKVSVGYTGHTAVRLGVSHILIEMWWKWAFSFNHRFLFVLFLFFFSSSLPVYFCASIARPTPGRRKKTKAACALCVCVCACCYTPAAKYHRDKKFYICGFFAGRGNSSCLLFCFCVKQMIREILLFNFK